MLRALVTSVIAVAGAAALLAGAAHADPPPPQIVTGLDAGWPDVRGWDAKGHMAQQYAPWGEWNLAFSAYDTYQQGVRLAVGDVNGDGRNEIVTAPGKDAWTELKVFDGRSYRQLKTLLPFKDAVWWAGAYVATGDTNGDGRDEVVEGLDTGCCTTLHVLDAVGGNDMSGFFPYGNNSEVGARVAAGDLNGDGTADVIAVPIGSTRISAFRVSGGSPFRTIDSFGAEISGPVSIAAGNLTGDARAEIVAAAPTGSGAEVKIFDATSGTAETTLYPYGGAAVSSVAVALGDVNGDGKRDIVLSADTPGGTEVKAVGVDGIELADFYVLDASIIPGASIAAGDLDGDGKAEIVLGGGPTTAPWPPVANGPDQDVAVYEPDGTEVHRFGAYPGLFQGGVRVGLADVAGDSRPEMIAAPGPGTEPEIGIWTQQWVNGRDRGTRLGHFLAFDTSFRGGVSIATGDVDGSGRAEIVAGSGAGRAAEVRVFDAQGNLLYHFAPFDNYDGGISVGAGDVDADGRAEIVVGTLTAPARIRVFDGTVQRGPTILPFGGGAAGVEVAVADIDGAGRGVIVAGEADGTSPSLSLIDAETGAVLVTRQPFGPSMDGLRIGAGDLDRDGRDEIVAASGFGGDSLVYAFDRNLLEKNAFRAYDWLGAGMNVGLAPRIGLPIAADARTVKLKVRKRAKVVVARFRDAGGGTMRLHTAIAWGDGTSAPGTLLPRGNGVYDVRGTKRYGRAGRFAITVTVKDANGRTSVARSTAVVARR
ncbi:MAG TPA: FG-GAP-like repeat-containing protein [Gaiellaceae bacterium]|nr:FG-GAP-like repeat-containing protein [Gaiellaceae bacterium]